MCSRPRLICLFRDTFTEHYFATTNNQLRTLSSIFLSLILFFPLPYSNSSLGYLLINYIIIKQNVYLYITDQLHALQQLYYYPYTYYIITMILWMMIMNTDDILRI